MTDERRAFIRERQPRDWLIQAAEIIGVTPIPHPFSELKSLPQASGVYLVDSGDLLYYVGAAVDFRARWKAHHRHYQLRREGADRIWLLETPFRDTWEPVLIKRLHPAFNGKPLPSFAYAGEISPERIRPFVRAMEEMFPADILREAGL